MHIIVMRQFEHNFCSQVGPCTRVPCTRYLGTLISVSVSSLFLSLPLAWIDPYFLCPAIFVVFTTDFLFHLLFYRGCCRVSRGGFINFRFNECFFFFFLFFFSFRKRRRKMQYFVTVFRIPREIFIVYFCDC